MRVARPLCPEKYCTPYMAPEQLCPVCLAVYELEKELADAKLHLREERERCAKIAEAWEPPMPPEMHGLRLQAELDQFDGKLRPIQIAAAKAVAAAIRKDAEKKESQKSIINHEEAEQLANLKREESNLARCYLDLKLQIKEAKALLKRFLDAGPEEEYQVILCKLSDDVAKFLKKRVDEKA